MFAKNPEKARVPKAKGMALRGTVTAPSIAQPYSPSMSLLRTCAGPAGAPRVSSPPLLALAFYHVLNNYAFYCLMTGTPTYLSNIQHFSVKKVVELLTNASSS